MTVLRNVEQRVVVRSSPESVPFGATRRRVMVIAKSRSERVERIAHAFDEPRVVTLDFSSVPQAWADCLGAAEREERDVVVLMTDPLMDVGSALPILTLAQAIVRHKLTSVLLVACAAQAGEVGKSVAAAASLVLRLEHPASPVSFLDATGFPDDGLAVPILNAVGNAGRIAGMRAGHTGVESLVLAQLATFEQPLTIMPGEHVWISGDCALAAALSERLRSLGAEVAVEANASKRVRPEQLAAAFLFLRRDGARKLVAALDPAVAGQALATSIQGIDEITGYLSRALPKVFCLCRGAEALFGWPGRLVEASTGAFAMTALRRLATPGATTTCIDWLTMSTAQESPDEASRLVAHGILPAEPKRDVETIIRLAARGGHYFAGTLTGSVTLPDLAAVEDAAQLSFRAMPMRAGTPGHALTKVGRDPMIDVVANVLRVDRTAIDLDVPLLELGLDSLLAIEIRERTRDELARDFDLENILVGATLRELMASTRPVAP